MEAVVEQKSEEMEEMKTLLKEYLSQYYKKRKRKKILQKRLANFRAEMLGPKALNYSPVPRSKTNKVSDEPAQFCIKQEEIEERIEKERKLASSAMLKVMDLLDFLPEDSDEKNILELRYVDNMSWTDIAKTQSMSKSRCIDYWNIGLEKLLAFKKVRVLLEDYEKELRKNDRK